MSDFDNELLRKGRPTLSKDKLRHSDENDFNDASKQASSGKFGGFKRSQELISKSSKASAEDMEIAAVEQALCRKYHIHEPKNIPNTIGNGDLMEDTHLTPVGYCLNDRKNPAIWGVTQKSRTFHTWITGATGSGKPIRDTFNVLYSPDKDISNMRWKKIGKIEEGDYVCTRNGNLARVTGVYHHHDEPVWELELKNGQIIECGAGHLWIIQRKSHGRIQEYVKTTEELFDEGVLQGGESRGGGVGFRNAIPLCNPIEMKATKQPIPPYTLGCLIGDGCIRRTDLKFSTGDKEMLDLIEQDCPSYMLIKSAKDPKDYGYRFIPRNGDNWIADELVKLGLFRCKSEDKFIPDIYLNCSIEQRLEILRGLMDTDGTAHKGRISFTTISDKLYKDVVYLVRSLGIDANVHIDYRPEKYKGNDRAYDVMIFAPDEQCMQLFKLSRKRDEYKKYCDDRSTDAITIYHENKPIDYETAVDPSYNAYFYGIALRSTTNQRAITTGKLTPHIKKRLVDEMPGTEFELYCQRDQNENIVLIDGCYWNGKRHNALLDEVEKMGLDKGNRNKEISDKVLHSSIEYRRSVFQAICDMWGQVSGRRIEICCKEKKVREGIIELGRSLGYICNEPDSNKRSASVKIIVIQVTSTTMFSDPDKIAEAQHVLDRSDDGRRSERKESTAIVDIRKTDRVADMTCLMVDDPTQSYLIENFTVTHNTTLLSNMIICDVWQHRGGLLIEPAGDLSEKILKSAPPYRIHDTVYLDLLDPLYAPGFNPLELPPTADADERQNAVGGVTTLMSNHFGLSGDMARLMKTLQSALNALSFVPGATILEIMDFYRNEDIQKTVLSFMPDGAMKDEIVNRATTIKVDELGSLENRISRFTQNRYLKHLFGQSHTTMNWLDLMNRGAMVICPIRKGGTADGFFVKFCGSYIVSEIFKASYQRWTIPEKDRIIFPVILDEFQNYVSGDIEHMLAECRKYGLAMVLSHQYISQVRSIMDAIDNSCRTKLAYAPSATDAPQMARSFPGITADELMNMPKYHIMAVVQQGGGPLAPFMTSVLPPIENTSPCADDVAELILELTHKTYMRPRTEIDKEIDERKEVLASGNKEAVVNFAKKCARRR